ncbi:MAG: adaptor protein MecA [Blautia sp.]|nr:adaptor protein MecA [Blautia sp.]
MKLEKINENQIRCTLSKEDLEYRQLRLSELAYGSEKAKRLFRDMMQQAQIQFGFEADNIPLMIEAIPVNMESIILIITKVEDPDELDTRFSKFAPFRDAPAADTLQFDGADNILDIFHKLVGSKLSKESPVQSQNENTAETAHVTETDASADTPVNLIRLYSFDHLDDVIAASRGLNGFYQGENLLYKESSTGKYLLILHQTETTPEDFNKVCNILSEYGSGKAFSSAGEAYLTEHGKLITRNALQSFTQL